MDRTPEQGLAAWAGYLRDMGVYDLYRRDTLNAPIDSQVLACLRARLQSRSESPHAAAAPLSTSTVRPSPAPGVALPPLLNRAAASPARAPAPGLERPAMGEPDPGQRTLPPDLAAPMPKPNPLEALFPSLPVAIPAAQRAAALSQLQQEIGDCTRCPLAYAGRHSIVFGEGDPNAELMFVGEGPGADEDASGRPFVGKAGQLLTNMVGAMGLQREQVYIANIVKCRPPGNRVPEFTEATTCSQFLLGQIDIVRPIVIVALGSTAATYLLGVRQSLASLRGQWLSARGAKVAVTYHPAFLLRDPRQKPEAWKDLQRVMGELGLKPPSKATQA